MHGFGCSNGCMSKKFHHLLQKSPEAPKKLSHTFYCTPHKSLPLPLWPLHYSLMSAHAARQRHVHVTFLTQEFRRMVDIFVSEVSDVSDAMLEDFQQRPRQCLCRQIPRGLSKTCYHHADINCKACHHGPVFLFFVKQVTCECDRFFDFVYIPEGEVSTSVLWSLEI